MLLMGNVCAYRATDPRDLSTGSEGLGDLNRLSLESMHDHADLVVAAWGANRLPAAGAEIARWVLSWPRVMCLGTTKAGHPRHPLYLSYDTPLKPCETHDRRETELSRTREMC